MDSLRPIRTKRFCDLICSGAFESKNVKSRQNKGKSQVLHNFLPYTACWINRTTFYFSPKSVLKKLNLFQVIGSLDHTCVFFGFRLTTLHPRLPSSICPFCPWTDIGPLHHPWDIWGKSKIRYGFSWNIDWNYLQVNQFLNSKLVL